MNPRGLKTLVLHVSARCDQACAHCSIWKGNGRGPVELGVDARLALIREASVLGASNVLFTGGEPLLCDHIEGLARAARDCSLAVQIATNGLGVAKAAPWLSDAVDELYVSVEGPTEIHDRVRGAGMFLRLKASLAALHRLGLDRRPRLIGRSVVNARNAHALEDTVEAARDLGLDALSFLPLDSTSMAFGGVPEERAPLRPDPVAVGAMKVAVRRLGAAGVLNGFVLESETKLTQMAESFLGRDADRRPPLCNAPEWSSVVEADGAVRPCFFQPKVTGPGPGLEATRRSEAYATALKELGPGNAACSRCVCPKYEPSGAAWVMARIAASFGATKALAGAGSRT